MLAHDPTEFLADIKAAGGGWSPMAAARLVLGTAIADSIRKAMGAHWLTVLVAARLEVAREDGEWSFAHSTLQSWLDYQADRIDDAEYWQRLEEHAADGKAEFLRIH